MRIAFLGIGLMGFPMARRLCEAGHSVRVWNRSIEKAQRLLPFGATVCASAPEAVHDAEYVVTMLDNGPVVAQVLFDAGTAAAMQTGALLIDMSSIKPAEARNHAQRLQAMGLRHLDAPVSGGTIGAEQGTLAIMAGGTSQDFEAARELLTVLGRPTRVGPHGCGQLAKLANQMIVGITIGVELLQRCCDGRIETQF